jgi:hypothetical protein
MVKRAVLSSQWRSTHDVQRSGLFLWPHRTSNQASGPAAPAQGAAWFSGACPWSAPVSCGALAGCGEAVPGRLERRQCRVVARGGALDGIRRLLRGAVPREAERVRALVFVAGELRPRQAGHRLGRRACAVVVRAGQGPRPPVAQGHLGIRVAGRVGLDALGGQRGAEFTGSRWFVHGSAPLVLASCRTSCGAGLLPCLARPRCTARDAVPWSSGPRSPGARRTSLTRSGEGPRPAPRIAVIATGRSGRVAGGRRGRAGRCS